LSCFACFCTEGCLSSLGSVCTAALQGRDPAIDQALVLLNNRAIEVLGEEGTAKALRSRLGDAILR
jgi:hypothetical protein